MSKQELKNILDGVLCVVDIGYIEYITEDGTKVYKREDFITDVEMMYNEKKKVLKILTYQNKDE